MLAALMIVIGACAYAAPLATFEPGKSKGIDIVSCEDGQWAPRTALGREAVTPKEVTTPPSGYLYFTLTAEVREKLGSDVYLVVDFLDEDIGPVGIGYNTSKDPYTLGPAYSLLATGGWQRALVHLADAKLAGLQNGGSDFRFSGPGSMVIARVEVYSENPNIEIPSDKERMMKNTRNTLSHDRTWPIQRIDASTTSHALGGLYPFSMRVPPEKSNAFYVRT